MNEQAQVLPGDRIPDFLRHDQSNQAYQIYKDACARSVILLLVRDPSAPEVAVEVQALARLSEEERPRGLIMIHGDPSESQRLAELWCTQATVLADDGAVLKFFLQGAPEGPVVALVLDRAHRSLGIIGPADIPLADRALKMIADSEPAPGRTVGAQAPVLVIPGVFETGFCRDLIEVFQTRGNEPSGILTMVEGKMVYQADRDTKIRHEHRVQDPDISAAIVNRLQRRVLPHIQWAFNYNVTRYEGIKIVLYDADEGGFFTAHRDNDGVDTAHRRFAMTLNLNAEDYEGGELRFPEFSDDLYKPASGSAVIFSCGLAHEALPVSRGQRFAVVSFFYSQQEQVHKVNPENRVSPSATPRRHWS